MNKSAIAREFWRKIFNENAIDLRNSDARKSVVKDFLNDPMNIKEGWTSKDLRFFRSALDKISREYGKSTSQFGIKPEPKRVKGNAGKMGFTFKTDEKPLHEIKKSDEEKKSDDDKKNPLPKNLQTKELLQQQQNIALTYTSQSVATIFETLFNILHSRFPSCSPLSRGERDSLGDAWYPIFNEFLSDKGGKWVLPAIITAPIVLVRFAEIQRAKKEQEVRDRYGIDEVQKPKEDKNKKKWSDNL